MYISIAIRTVFDICTCTSTHGQENKKRTVKKSSTRPFLVAMWCTRCQNLNDLTHVLVHSDQEECSTTKAEKRMTGEKYNTVHLHYAGTNAECACKTQTVHLHYEGGGEINSPHVHWITEEEIQGKH